MVRFGNDLGRIWVLIPPSYITFSFGVRVLGIGVLVSGTGVLVLGIGVLDLGIGLLFLGVGLLEVLGY